MSSPIDNGPRLPLGGAGGANRKTAVDGAGSQPGAKANEADQASVDASVQSERLKAVQESIDNTPEVDMEKVEAIKQSIAEGRFPIDPQRIAEKFAELEGLLNR